MFQRRGRRMMEDVITAALTPPPELIPEPVIPMPDPEDAGVRATRRRSMAEQRRRRGRASTIMTSGDTLG